MVEIFLLLTASSWISTTPLRTAGLMTQIYKNIQGDSGSTGCSDFLFLRGRGDREWEWIWIAWRRWKWNQEVFWRIVSWAIGFYSHLVFKLEVQVFWEFPFSWFALGFEEERRKGCCYDHAPSTDTTHPSPRKRFDVPAEMQRIATGSWIYTLEI